MTGCLRKQTCMTVTKECIHVRSKPKMNKSTVTIQYNTMQYNTIQDSTIQYYTILNSKTHHKTTRNDRKTNKRRRYHTKRIMKASVM